MSEGSRGRPAPALVLFDVNETLSDLGPLREAFMAAGLQECEVEPWFAGVLRDGFALTCVGQKASFADLAAEGLRIRLYAGGALASEVDEHVERVMSTFTSLSVHPDVVPGMRALHDAGVRLVTLSNGSAGVAEGLLERAGVADLVERTLSVDDAPAWKPHAAAYAYALEVCGAPAEAAMLVAVHPWDVDGAARAGLRTGWIDRRRAPYPSYFSAPEVEAADLPGLVSKVCS